MGQLFFDFSRVTSQRPTTNVVTFDFEQPNSSTYQGPPGSNFLVDFITTAEDYTPPTGNNVVFDFNPTTIEPPDPGQNTVIPEIRFVSSLPYQRATPSTTNTSTPWGVTDTISVINALNYGGNFNRIDLVYTTDLDYNLNFIDLGYLLSYGGEFTQLTNNTETGFGSITTTIDITNALEYGGQFTQPQAVYGDQWSDIDPRDSNITFTWNAVRLEGVERIEGVTTPIQPVTSATMQRDNRLFEEISNSRIIAWGYGLNSFLVGGSTDFPSNIDTTDPDGPIIHIDPEVFVTVNIVNITVRPSNTVINFDNFSIQRDVESFAWQCTFDVSDRASFNLIRPVGRTLKTIDISINETVFTVFVTRTSTQRRAGGVEVFNCTGFSTLRQLSAPYSSPRSFTDTIQRTAAQIVVRELTGTGFTNTWSTTDWNVPLGVHSYQNQTPLGAILQVVNAIGGVIVPHNTNQTFDVQPFFPISPWNWDTAVPNRRMNETQFFTIDNETVPGENPDGVFVFGQEQGVGVRAVRQGLPGTQFLPDVIDKYITAIVAGQERARQEVARNSFIERIPMTTYVDENGIIFPQELIEFTTPEGTTWRGMVLSTRVDCQRIGTSLSQSITVARFYDD